MIASISAGLLLGLAGSLHCVGMCGPLSLALPVHHLPFGRRAGILALYHLGRIATYALIGFAFGLAGHRLYLAGMQQVMSIVLGALLLLLSIQYFSPLRFHQPAVIKKLHIGLQYRMAALLRHNAVANYLLLGALNGLLPCGMVYVAVAGAMSTNDVWRGTLFMSSFGFATLPAMMMLGMFGYLASPGVRSTFRRLSPYMVCLLGVWLVLRGMNLGIPFISPAMQPAPGVAVSCH